MAKKVMRVVKLQVPGGNANTGRPVGPALGQIGLNIKKFCDEFNERTQDKRGLVIPVEITVYEDRSFDFVTKTPPAAELLLKAANIKKGSGTPNQEKVATISKEQVREIAEMKLPDLNATDVDAAVRIIEGTARSMGIAVAE